VTVPDLSVDPESIRSAADELQRAADDLDEVVGRFVQTLGQFGDPWGMDMLGSLIGGGYVAIEQLALETLDSIVESLDADAEGLATMAASYTEVEDTNTTGLDTFHGRL